MFLLAKLQSIHRIKHIVVIEDSWHGNSVYAFKLNRSIYFSGIYMKCDTTLFSKINKIEVVISVTVDTPCVLDVGALVCQVLKTSTCFIVSPCAT